MFILPIGTDLQHAYLSQCHCSDFLGNTPLGGNHRHADVPFQQQKVSAVSFYALLCLILELLLYSAVLYLIQFALGSAHVSCQSKQEQPQQKDFS